MLLGFQKIVGHEGQIALLRRAVERDRLHHAYLFVGPEGMGKRTVATALTAAVQCSGGAGEACGECSNCRAIEHDSHPDVHRLEPRTGKRDITMAMARALHAHLGISASVLLQERGARIEPAPGTIDF